MDGAADLGYSDILVCSSLQLGGERLTLRPGVVSLDDGQHTILGGKLGLRGVLQGDGGSRGGEGEVHDLLPLPFDPLRQKVVCDTTPRALSRARRRN